MEGADMGKLIGITAVVFVVVLLISFGWRSVEDTREDKAEIAWQSDRLGQRSTETFTYDRDLPAEQPFLFAVGTAGVVFVVGLLVIIASNSDRR
jgi:hypothetical protein